MILHRELTFTSFSVVLIVSDKHAVVVVVIVVVVVAAAVLVIHVAPCYCPKYENTNKECT